MGVLRFRYSAVNNGSGEIYREGPGAYSYSPPVVVTVLTLSADDVRSIAHDLSTGNKEILPKAAVPPTNGPGDNPDLMDGGPTFEEYVDAGYNPNTYPPKGYRALESAGWTDFQRDKATQAQARIDDEAAAKAAAEAGAAQPAERAGEGAAAGADQSGPGLTPDEQAAARDAAAQGLADDNAVPTVDPGLPDAQPPTPPATSNKRQR